MRCTREQIHWQNFLDAVAETFPFLECVRDFVGAAENVQYANRVSCCKCADYAGLRALARRVKQYAFGLVGAYSWQAHLQKLFVDFTGDKAVVLFQELGTRLRRLNGRTFPFHAENALGGFTETETEEPVTAVQVQESVARFECEQAACGLYQVMNLAFVDLAEACGGVLEAEMSEVERKFARSKELLEAEPVGRTLCFEVIVGFCRVEVGVCCGHVVRALLQYFGNLLQLAYDACVDFLDVENDYTVLVGAADDNPVERIGQGFVSWRNQLFEKHTVNGVVLFGLQNAIVSVETEVARIHFDTALARGAVVSGHGACYHGLRAAGEPVHFPELANGCILDLELVLVIERGERLAVGGIGFLGVVRQLVRDGLLKKHVCLRGGRFLRAQI